MSFPSTTPACSSVESLVRHTRNTSKNNDIYQYIISKKSSGDKVSVLNAHLWANVLEKAAIFMGADSVNTSSNIQTAR